MPALAGLRMLSTDNRDYLYSTLLEGLRNFNGHDIAATRRSHQRGIARRQIEVAQNAFREAGNIFQEHRLPLSIGAHDKVMKTQRKLDDGIEAGERAVARPHFLDENAAVARTEKMN